MKIIRKVRAPVRIDFAGGTTDIEPFSQVYGGAIVNATIDKYIEGKLISSSKEVGLEYKGDIPTSSGLGTSGVMNLVWLSLISNIKKLDERKRKELAERVYKLEQTMGIVGGKQDQYASVFGGFNFFEFKNEKVKRKKLELKKSFIRELEKSLVLVYIGPHFSGTPNKLVIENFIQRKNVKSFLRIKEIAYEVKTALLKKDLTKFSELMNEETIERKKLHPLIVDSYTEKFMKKGLKNGALAVKVCGAGNRGSILFFTEKRKKLEREFKKRIIKFKFSFEGLKFL